jgi:lipopolysaccharide transport system ATP-binding protein
MHPIIRAQHLGKEYRLGEARAPYSTLRESLVTMARAPLRVFRGDSKQRSGKSIWALRDIDLEIGVGQVVGIIGRNGAGKSTLLKILSRITEPTTGRAELFGRVGSLLEVGTGFHPELTGRDNIFLNGAILGMRRKEIARKFDEIVAFAELDEFIDTPVKRYSTGMYMRLGFAVAAHLESEILFVDEVLAVGDAQFQKKCLGKMEDVATHGRTICFVSHNMSAILHLCPQCMLLTDGRLAEFGETSAVIERYMAAALSPEDHGAFDLSSHPARRATSRPIIQGLALYNGDLPGTRFFPGDSLTAELAIVPPFPVREPRVAIAIEDSMGRRITTVATWFQGSNLADFDRPCRVRCTIPRLDLGAGRYAISVGVGDRDFEQTGALDTLESVAWFEVVWNDHFRNGAPFHAYYGPVLTLSEWSQDFS